MVFHFLNSTKQKEVKISKAVILITWSGVNYGTCSIDLNGGCFFGFFLNTYFIYNIMNEMSVYICMRPGVLQEWMQKNHKLGLLSGS